MGSTRGFNVLVLRVSSIRLSRRWEFLTGSPIEFIYVQASWYRGRSIAGNSANISNKIFTQPLPTHNLFINDKIIFQEDAESAPSSIPLNTFFSNLNFFIEFVLSLVS